MQDNSFSTRLAEALTSRLCHELVNPIGAVANGVEILRDDPAFAADATAMIGLSVRQATRRLQFYRFAYGSTNEPGEEGARAATIEFFEESKITCVWPEFQNRLLPGWTKLIMNLVVLAAECIPRGGTLVISALPGSIPIVIHAEGKAARIPEDTLSLLSPYLSPERIVPRSVHTVFTASLAYRLSCQIAMQAVGPERIQLSLEASY